MLDAIVHFFRALFDPEGLKELIRHGGAPLICTIVFIETGFFVGFFLPGDSLLVTAGILSAGDVKSAIGSAVPRARRSIAARILCYFAAATFGAPMTSTKNTAGGPLSWPDSFPSCAPFALP